MKALSILTALNVATPATAATVKVPPRVADPVDGSVPNASVTLSVLSKTSVPFESLSSTVIAEDMLTPATVLVG